jgi:mono/diheme cytochrome c family protein
MVARGKTVYAGPGLCFACHGPTGAGGVGPSLTDTVWLHHDGSFDALVRQIREGIPLGESKGGQIMPPRGGGAISEQDLSAVAAYVWTLSRVPRSPR